MQFLLFGYLSLVWGSAFILMKVAVESISASVIAFSRLFLGALTLFLIIKLTKQKFVRGLNWKLLFFISFVGQVIPFCIQPFVIKEVGSSSLVGMIIIFVPIFTILVSAALIKRKPLKKELVGTAGGLASLMLFYYESALSGVDLSPLLLALLVPLCYSISNVLIKKGFQDYPSILLTFFNLLLGAIMVLPMTMIDTNQFSGLISPWAALIFLSIFGTGIAIYVFIYLIQTQGPLFAGMTGYSVPLVAVGFGFIYGEDISITQLYCLMFTILMVLLVQVPQATMIKILSRLKYNPGRGS